MNLLGTLEGTLMLESLVQSCKIMYEMNQLKLNDIIYFCDKYECVDDDWEWIK